MVINPWTFDFYLSLGVVWVGLLTMAAVKKQWQRGEIFGRFFLHLLIVCWPLAGWRWRLVRAYGSSTRRPVSRLFCDLEPAWNIRVF